MQRIYGVFLSILLFLNLPAAAKEESLAELAQRIDAPRMGGVVQEVGHIQVGRGTIKPRSPVRILLCGEEPCGLWVTGDAGFVYRVEDRFSVPVARRNFKTSSPFDSKEIDGGLEVRTLLEGAVIWGWDLASGYEPAPVDKPTTLPGWATQLLDRPFFHLPSISLILERRLQASAGRYALLHGRNFDLWLVVDPARQREEQLARMEALKKGISVPHAGRYYGIDLATQPIGRQWWEHEVAPLVVVHRTLSVDQDEGQHATVTSTTHIEGRTAENRLWWVSLVDHLNRDDKVFPLRLRSVEVDGKPADYLFQGSRLMVALDPALGAGKRTVVKVVQEGDYALRIDGHKYWVLGTWPWFPTADPNAELATLDLTVRAPSSLEIFASGATVSRRQEGDFTVLETRLENPAILPVVVAGKYHVFRDSQLGIDATVATYYGKDKRGASKLLNNFFAAVDCYQRYFDVPYPFREVEILERASWGWGQAPPGIIFITQEAVNPLLETRDRWYSKGVNGRFFHEVAHGWWPHATRLDAGEENWISESFADYTSAVCLDAASGGKGSFGMRSSLDGWRGQAKDLGEGGSLYLASHLAHDRSKNQEARRDLLYAKGPLVLHALRQELKRQAGEEIGEKQFWILLRSYLKSFSHTWGGTQYLVAMLDQITGKSWQPWFERYVYGTEMPPIAG